MNPIEIRATPTGRVEIYFDPDPLNPRTEWDNVATMQTWHRRYTLGDIQPDHDPDTALWHLAREIHPDFPAYDDTEWVEGMWADKVQQIIAKHYVVRPLYLYDHSGLSISTGAFSCPWDSGQVGFIHIGLEAARRAWNLPDASWETLVEDDRTMREWAEGCVESEVETYDAYLRGMVYGFKAVAVDPFGNEEEVDSCWGFYDDKEAMAQGLAALPGDDPNRVFDAAEAELAI